DPVDPGVQSAAQMKHDAVGVDSEDSLNPPVVALRPHRGRFLVTAAHPQRAEVIVDAPQRFVGLPIAKDGIRLAAIQGFAVNRAQRGLLRPGQCHLFELHVTPIRWSCGSGSGPYAPRSTDLNRRTPAP